MFPNIVAEGRNGQKLGRFAEESTARRPILDSETVPRESRLCALPKPSPQISPTPPHAPAQACNGDLRASARVLPLILLRPVRGRCEVPRLPSDRNSFPTEHKKNDEAKQDCRSPHDHLHADYSRHQHPDHARPPSPLPEPARLHRHLALGAALFFWIVQCFAKRNCPRASCTGTALRPTLR